MQSERRHIYQRLLPPLNKLYDQCGEFNFKGSQRLLSLLVDKSISMEGTAIEQVNRGAANFAHDCCQDILTRDSLQVQLVTFGGPVKIYPFVPIAHFIPPTLHASGDTPLAEALIAAVAETKRYTEFLQTREVEIIKPNYFVFTDGQPNPSSPIAEAAACIRQYERNRQGAFYGFGIDQAAVEALQPLFVREVQLLSQQNFADFFRIISASVRRISVSCISEDIDLTPLIKESLRLGHEDGNHA